MREVGLAQSVQQRGKRSGFDFQQWNIRSESATHPASYPMDTGDPFLGDKAAEAWSWLRTSIQYRTQERWSYTSTFSYVFTN
jgi:hypothetical protein